MSKKYIRETPPPIKMLIEILTSRKASLKVLALCGNVIESYHNSSRRSLQSKRYSHELNPTTDEEREKEEARYSVYSELLEEAHRMVLEGSPDHEQVADKLARAVDVLDSFRPYYIFED
ncbi:hypothetical protein [Enhygromyxa salina]|uniref:hypothetical protein n=1 Tax=Enhygromyxa salina TaxID=215803 RepID=UPI000698CA34|nr:hypothetical protein [Enhygromyxa salina]